MKQSLRLKFREKDFFPLGQGGMFGAVSTTEPRQPILQDSRWVLEEALVLMAFSAEVEPYLRCVKRGVQRHHKFRSDFADRGRSDEG